MLVPFVELRPETRAAIVAADVDARLARTHSSPDAYWRLLAEWWSKGESFIVVEQDKVPEPGLLEEMWACDGEWCTARVAMRGTVEPAPYPSLSCTKFGAGVLAAEPWLMRDVGELDLGFGVRDWSRLDLAVAGLLVARGWEPHYHAGVVEHLHGPV